MQIKEDYGDVSINHLIKLFVQPELDRRFKDRTIEYFSIYAVQIIFFPDERKTQVKINNEITSMISIKPIEDISNYSPGDLMNTTQFSEIGSVELSEDDDPDCAHATIIFSNDRTLLHFDFRYNKALIMKLSEKAFEFFLVALYAYEKKFWSPFVDNLYSATELLAKAILLIHPDKELRKKASHAAIHQKFNSYVKLGNADKKFSDALNKLEAFRNQLRYMNQNGATFSELISEHYIDTVREMIDHTTKLIGLTLTYVDD